MWGQFCDVFAPNAEKNESIEEKDIEGKDKSQEG